MRAQNRLIAFVARYVSVTSSRTSRFGFSAERTLILPGDVRYELDLSKLQARDVTWDAGSQTLSVRLPEIEIAGPDVDLNSAREYGEGGVLSALTNAEQGLDQANRSAAVADLRKQASADVPMRLEGQPTPAQLRLAQVLAKLVREGRVVRLRPKHGGAMSWTLPDVEFHQKHFGSHFVECGDA